MLGAPRFLDASIFINWLKTQPKYAVRDPVATTSGYVLKKIEGGEPAVTTITIKDEVCIWLSRYKPSSLLRIACWIYVSGICQPRP